MSNKRKKLARKMMTEEPGLTYQAAINRLSVGRGPAPAMAIDVAPRAGDMYAGMLAEAEREIQLLITGKSR